MSSLDVLWIGLRVLFAAAGWLIAYIAWRAWKRECDEGRADRHRLIRQKCQALLVGRQACDEADKTLRALSAACKDNARLRRQVADLDTLASSETRWADHYFRKWQAACIQVEDLTFLATSQRRRVDYYSRKWRAAEARLEQVVP